MSAAALDAVMSGRRTVSTDEALEWQRRRSLRWWTDVDTGMVRFSGRLPDVDAEVVTTVLGRISTRLAREAAIDTENHASLSADALVELASTQLATDADGDRACVVVGLARPGRALPVPWL